MKKLFIVGGIEYISAVYLSFIHRLLTPLFLSAEVVDKVVAVVNDEVITLSELEEETAVLFPIHCQRTSQMNRYLNFWQKLGKPL